MGVNDAWGETRGCAALVSARERVTEGRGVSLPILGLLAKSALTKATPFVSERRCPRFAGTPWISSQPQVRTLSGNPKDQFSNFLGQPRHSFDVRAAHLGIGLRRPLLAVPREAAQNPAGGPRDFRIPLPL